MSRKRRPADEYSEQYAAAERLEARNAEAFEGRSLEFLLRTFGMMPRVGRMLRQQYERRTGRYALLFREFNREYPSFPVLLGADRLPGLHVDARTFLPALFRQFDQSPFALAYEAFYERAEGVADGRAIGLVVSRKGIPRGLIIHNGVDLPQRVFRGLCMVYQGGRGKATTRLFVQPFQTLVAELHHGGHGWRPDS